MNSEKARDFFSAYYEGTLEPGLVLNLEQKFKADPSLRGDYDAFAAAFTDLNSLREESIEVPIFLSDRIATRLEEARQQKRKSFSLFNLRWMRFAPYALAGLAIVGAGLGIATKGKGFSTANFVPWMSDHNSGPDVPTKVDGPSFSFDGSRVLLEVQGTHSVTVSDGVSGKVLRTVNAEESRPIQPQLTNNGATAELFGVREDGGSTQMVAVPGSSTVTSSPKGEGTLGQFAVALSDYYHVPVLLENIKADTQITWSFDGTNAQRSAQASLQPAHLQADLRADGMISINGH
jgi:hypothetical protein